MYVNKDFIEKYNECVFTSSITNTISLNSYITQNLKSLVNMSLNGRYKRFKIFQINLNFLV